MFEKMLGPEHRDVGTALNNVAGLHFAQSDWTDAAKACADAAFIGNAAAPDIEYPLNVDF